MELSLFTDAVGLVSAGIAGVESNLNRSPTSICLESDALANSVDVDACCGVSETVTDSELDVAGCHVCVLLSELDAPEAQESVDITSAVVETDGGDASEVVSDACGCGAGFASFEAENADAQSSEDGPVVGTGELSAGAACEGASVAALSSTACTGGEEAESWLALGALSSSAAGAPVMSPDSRCRLTEFGWVPSAGDPLVSPLPPPTRAMSPWLPPPC